MYWISHLIWDEVIYTKNIFELYEYSYHFQKIREDRKHRQKLRKKRFCSYLCDAEAVNGIGEDPIDQLINTVTISVNHDRSNRLWNGKSPQHP